MFQNWKHLLFLHWEIPFDEIREKVPRSLDIDLFEGKAYIGLIPFTLSGVRLAMTPAIPGISSFHEVNIRTYVSHKGGNPGVWFFSLDASSILAVEAARLLYHLPYYPSEIDFHGPSDQAGLCRFNSSRTLGGDAAVCRVSYAPDGPAAPASPGTIDHFVTERYILYTEHNHVLRRARVHHHPYMLQRASVSSLEETLVWASGLKRPEVPVTRHYSAGVNVKIYGPEIVAV
ncbi:MAG TPA: DUF2071 domain-containing protein [Thermoanaerobaculia bacterium]|nr:DUF2071 domain-containing protein [Thermoanaerobaculia bacterium]